MKNGLLVWNLILTLAVGYLVIFHFRNGKKSEVNTSTSNADSLKHNSAFKIAFFEMDSVEANFEMVKQVKAELTAKEQAINDEMDRLGKEIQQKYAYYQNRAAAGNLPQDESEAASLELKAMDEKMRNRKSQMDQEYFELNKKKQNEVKTKIQEFINGYNKEKKYAFIVSDDPGIFYYLDKAYNITQDVIKGLNNLYKSAKK